MGAEEKSNAETPNMSGEQVEAPAAPPPEEPPKIEDIVTQEVLQAIINGYDSTAKLISFKAEPGTKIGDNYMSIMYAVDLELETKGGKEALSVMLKTIPRNIFRAEMINEMMAFKKETTIYQQVFPKMICTQVEKEIPEEQRFTAWPICYAAHLDGSTDFLAMENLRISGFKMGNRMVGLDFNHCVLVLRNLARYHATSYATFEGSRDKIIEAFPVLNMGMFNKETKVAEMQQQFFSQSFIQQAESLKSFGEEYGASYLEKIAKLDLLTVLGNLTTKNIDQAVITHGDCWVNNMLFKYDEKDEKCSHPVSVKFIDFQIAMASSRLVDVYYFMMTSGIPDVVAEREQDLLMTYYAEFTASAQNLGVNTKECGLSWENFLKEASKYKLYGVLLGILLAPMLSAESADIPDMESFTQEDMENTDETITKFFKDLNKENAVKKVKALVLNHLIKCEGIDALI